MSNYNLKDMIRSKCKEMEEVFYEECRRKLMPRFGSAWENMMDQERSKEGM